MIVRIIEITTSTTPICPSTNNDGDKIADIKGTNDKILINNDPSNIPATIDK